MSINKSDKGGFIQRVRYEDEIMKQISYLIQCMSDGDKISSNLAFKALEDMLYGIPKIDFTEYDIDQQLIDDEWKVIFDKKIKEFDKSCVGAVAPGLMERKRPKNIMNIQFIRRKERIILKMFADNGITLTSKNVAHL